MLQIFKAFHGCTAKCTRYSTFHHPLELAGSYIYSFYSYSEADVGLTERCCSWGKQPPGSFKKVEHWPSESGFQISWIASQQCNQRSRHNIPWCSFWTGQTEKQRVNPASGSACPSRGTTSVHRRHIAMQNLAVSAKFCLNLELNCTMSEVRML